MGPITLILTCVLDGSISIVSGYPLQVPQMLKVYDPRRAENFQVKFGTESFSSLDHGLLAIVSQPQSRLFGLITTFPGTIDIGNYADLMRKCIRATSRHALFTCNPATPDLRQRLKCFSSYQEHETSVFAYIDLESDDLLKLLQVRSETGDYREWIIGGARDELMAPRRLSFWRSELWGFGHLVRQIEKIGCLFVQEGNSIIIISRLFDGVDEIIELAGQYSRSEG